MATQRMVVHDHWQARLDRRPDSRDNTRMKCEHAGDLHLVVVLGSRSASQRSQDNDRWMVNYRGPIGAL